MGVYLFFLHTFDPAVLFLGILITEIVTGHSLVSTERLVYNSVSTAALQIVV